MKNKLIILVGLVLGAGLFSGCSKITFEIAANNQSSLAASQESVDSGLRMDTNNLINNLSGESSTQNSIGWLLNQQKDLKCSWRIEKAEVIEEAEMDNEDEEITGGIEEGVVYVSGGKFYQVIRIQENNRENTVNLLNNRDFIYQWSSINHQGTKMILDKSKEIEIVDLNKKYDWVCEDWLAEPDFFKIPEGVKFIEI